MDPWGAGLVDLVKGWFSGTPESKDLTFIPADADHHGIGGMLPRTRYPYRHDVRHGLASNVIMAPVNWILRNFTQAEAIVERRMERTWAEAPDHGLKVLLDSPNDFYNGDLLWKATLASFVLDGNGYWRKIRNSFGEVIQLWYIPHFLIQPKSPQDGSAYISHYEYRPGYTGRAIELAPRDVVHFKFGLDPRDPRLGISSLKPLLRELFTDEEAANFSATILRNMGVPGGVLSPKDTAAATQMEEDEVAEMKAYMRTAFTGDKRGEWFVAGVPTDVKQFGFDPNSLMLTNLRDITEERVCAMLGIPAAVVGFGAGLQQTKVGATMRELREEAWSSGIEPHQKTLGRQVTDNLVPDFQSQTRRFRVRFDTSKVPALIQRNAEVQGQLVKDGIQRIDRAQEALGLEVDDSQAGYLRPSTSVYVPANEEPQGVVAPPPSANGTGGESREELVRRLMAEAANGGTDE